MTLQDIAAILETVGFPALFGAFAIWVFGKLVSAGFSDHAAAIRRHEEDRKELISLRAEHDELEKRFTRCREDLKEIEGRYELQGHIQKDAVEAFMDDTQTRTMELRDLQRQVIDLTLERNALKAQLENR